MIIDRSSSSIPFGAGTGSWGGISSKSASIAPVSRRGFGSGRGFGFGLLFTVFCSLVVGFGGPKLRPDFLYGFARQGQNPSLRKARAESEGG
jgi:hypothetical protein